MIILTFLFCFSPSLDVIVIHFWTFMAQFFYSSGAFTFPNSCGLCGALAPSYCLGKVYSRDLGIQSVNSLIFPHPGFSFSLSSSCTINYNLERSMTKECQREPLLHGIKGLERTLQITTIQSGLFQTFQKLASRVCVAVDVVQTELASFIHIIFNNFIAELNHQVAELSVGEASLA